MAKKPVNSYQGDTAQKMNVSNKQSQYNSGINANKAVSVIEKKPSRNTKEPVVLTHDQIAERAKGIWMDRGCPTNQDEKNWYDAENQLKQELGIH